jgi:hypothetical protein
METYEAESAPRQAEANDAIVAATTSPGAGPPRLRRRVWVIGLVFGLAGGLLAWGLGELSNRWFRPRLVQVVILGIPSMQPTRESQSAADTKNAALAFALLGSVTGLAMGFGGGVAGRSRVRGAAAGLGAMLLGGLIAAGASVALLPLFFRGLVPDVSDLVTPILIHSAIWGAIGAVAGLAFAIGMNRARHVPDAIIGACLGTVLATILFHCTREMLFPASRSSDPLGASPIVRFLAFMLVSSFQALGAVWGTTQGLARLPSSASRSH